MMFLPPLGSGAEDGSGCFMERILLLFRLMGGGGADIMYYLIPTLSNHRRRCDVKLHEFPQWSHDGDH